MGEVHHAFEEGVLLTPLTAPVRYIGNDEQWVTGMECIKFELGEPDESGRRRPVAVPNSEHIIDVDQVVVSIGGGANRLLTNTFPELELNKWGYIVTDDDCRTNIPGVFAGGDIVRGSATVILAMGDGRAGATAVHNFLESGKWRDE
eukprot:NODE_1561_length_581_cov_299.032751_g1548_i0.p1 GENE.NODE_1561_length_581_cov_299.032751_g1548_i0~~NODE_1561_length_581_cov_299.032751_g1548_i0.p1  ORF type:complete len:147 (-),score=11.18 NODE_1561_length_581_cov_299.032751_g1548_i0:113-553(-)